MWRVGSKVKLNVYGDSGQPVCQCHNERDALLIVEAVNRIQLMIVSGQQLEAGYLRHGGLGVPIRREYTVLEKLEDNSYVVVCPS